MYYEICYIDKATTVIANKLFCFPKIRHNQVLLVIYNILLTSKECSTDMDFLFLQVHSCPDVINDMFMLPVTELSIHSIIYITVIVLEFYLKKKAMKKQPLL